MKTRQFRRKSCTVILLFNVFFVCVIFLSSYHTTRRLRRLKEGKVESNLKVQQQILTSYKDNTVDPAIDKNPDEILILFWTSYFQGDITSEPAWKLMKSTYSECFANCRFVFDRRYLSASDAVVFHSRDMRKDEMPSIHNSTQIWVYLQQESPVYTKEDLSDFLNVFNWTMTYRRDSDVYHPYYKIFPLEGEHSTPHDILSGVEKSKEHKTKLVLWIVSNCHTQSKREEYVSELERFVPVDIYGSCGDFPCSRDGGGCLPAISHQYKFYLSFENSLCNDYITEKLFIVMQYDIVPVVFGGGDYESVAPPGSYIDANDFESPRALADYLIFLNKNPDKYLEYFQWKSKYKVNIGDGWCSLCRQLTEQKANPVKKQYPNLWGWWNYMDLGSNVTTQTQNFDSQHKPVCQAPVEASTDSFRLTDFAVRFRQLRRWLRLEVLG